MRRSAMNKSFPLTIGLAVLFVAGFLCGQTSAEPEEMLARRFALIIGANSGGSGRVTLRYALDDARAVRNVLHDLGGIIPGDSVFLEQPDRTTVFRELRNLGAKLDQARPRFRRIEMIFYYSGHSDEEHVLLGEERISYEELRAAVTALNADVRIAILDSCASGAFTLPKGVKKRSPFLLDAAYDMKGYAFMTSSSADEASQESRRLQGSFFTHNLVSAMRGAADRNQDGRITLTEAYQFAFDETLAQTEKTMSGPQHPNYNIQMSGTGDVVITDVSKSAALLTLKSDVAGRFFIHNQADILVVELGKPSGREITIGLEDGTYRITSVSDNAVYEAEVLLRKGVAQEIGRSRFEQVDKIPTRSRGDRSYVPSFRPRRASRWQVDVFGGVSQTDPKDLNYRTEIDQGSLNVMNDKYRYLRQTGEISFYQAKMGSELRPLRWAIPWGFRVRRSFNNWFSISLGLTGLWGTAVSDSQNSFTVIETSGRQYIYNCNIENYTLSVRGWIPTLAVHAGWNLTRALRLESRIGAGPLFASCRYFMDSNDVPLSDTGVILEEPSVGMLEERGRGIGWALDGGIGAQLVLGRNLGLQFEAGYSLLRVDHLAGPGKSYSSLKSDDWNGDWAMKYFLNIKPWGHYETQFPSNYWPDGELPLRLRNFELNLSGFQFKIGFSFKL